MADRYTYIPLVGVFIVFAWIAAGVCVEWRMPKTAIIIATAAVLVACGGRTMAQLRHWRGGENLFRHALAVTRNNHIAHYNLGTALLAKGEA